VNSGCNGNSRDRSKKNNGAERFGASGLEHTRSTKGDDQRHRYLEAMPEIARTELPDGGTFLMRSGKLIKMAKVSTAEELVGRVPRRQPDWFEYEDTIHHLSFLFAHYKVYLLAINNRQDMIRESKK